MKKICLLLLLLITTGLHAQIQKMSELSKNKFLDSEIIYDDNGEDVWGYLLLNKVDKVSKKFLELEFIILDKNLNKIGSNTFQQDYYDSWLIDILPNINSVYKNKNELLFAIGFDYDELFTTNPYAFRKVNLSDFSISDSFVFIDDKKIEDNNIMDRLISEKNDPSYFMPIKNSGFLTFKSKQNKWEQQNSQERNGFTRKIEKNQISYDYFDLDFNKKWTYTYDKIEDGFENHKFLYSNSNILIFLKENGGKAFKNKDKFYYKIVEQNTGAEISTIPLFDSIYTYTNLKVIFDKENIIFFDKIYDRNVEKSFVEFKTENNYSLYESLGISKRVFNIKTKTIVEQRNIFWEDLSKFINIDKHGFVKDSGFIQILDVKITSDNKVVMIGEGFAVFSVATKTTNLYAIEMNEEFKAESVKEIVKSSNTIANFSIWGDVIEKNNLFDFMYSQKVNENEYVYFYQDKVINKDPNDWVLGVITYADGEFKSQKINLKTQNGKIIPSKAKKGYIILQEISKNDNEIRLEKIEY